MTLEDKQIPIEEANALLDSFGLDEPSPSITPTWVEPIRDFDERPETDLEFTNEWEGWISYKPPGESGQKQKSAYEWPIPEQLPVGLAPVAQFDAEFLPGVIKPWVSDIAERMQCPPDFVAVSAITALCSVLGRKVGVRPKQRTDWTEVPTMWCCIVGPPGAMKSPAMGEALKPLKRLQGIADEKNINELRRYSIEVDAYKIRKEVATANAKIAIRNGDDALAILDIVEPEAPAAHRYIANDVTYEALGEIMAKNTNGILSFRDELMSLLKWLRREDNVSANGFFLQAWDGKSSYTFDRIIRGKVHIKAACLSQLGSTQPGRLAEYMREGISGGGFDDGMIQRFGFLIWPDQTPEWRNVDDYPDSTARQAAWSLFQRFDELEAGDVSAEQDMFGDIPFLRFDEAAQALFNDWQLDLETLLRSGELHSAIDNHFAKYRKLIPTLALINQIADGGGGPINEPSLLRAIKFSEYLKSHARRAYGSGINAETAIAQAILHRIRKGNLEDPFCARDVYRPQWKHLTDRVQIQAGLGLLVENEWLRPRIENTGGRRMTLYDINPRGVR